MDEASNERSGISFISYLVKVRACGSVESSVVWSAH